MTEVNPVLHESWKNLLLEQFQSPYFFSLKEFLLEEKKKHAVFPPGSQIFNAFNYTPFGDVKAVILGQDPYHGDGQAHGLCFSVPRGIRQPPSLVNIFKELESDIGIKAPVHGDLESWTRQGVLLLNATLTVRANQAGSHQGKGWETFTDNVIKLISGEKENVVFILWGNYARAKRSLIDCNRHYILQAAHPSPFSAYNGFFGCRHFSKANEFLRSKGIAEIDWKIE